MIHAWVWIRPGKAAPLVGKCPWAGSGGVGKGLGKAWPSLSPLACTEAMMNLPVCLNARNRGILGRARLQHPLARVGTRGEVGQVRLQHLIAKVKIGNGLCWVE